jgi:hypothetical protein
MSLHIARSFLILFIGASLVGCGPSYTVRPMEISVNTYESSQPVTEVDVKVIYSAWLFVDDVPQDVAGRTDKDGKVILPVGDFKEGAVNLKIGNPWSYFNVTPEVARHGGEATEHGDEPSHEYRVTLKPAPK